MRHTDTGSEMYEFRFRGAKRTSNNPVVSIAAKILTFVNVHGQTREIPAGSIIKQFETTNFGWTVWRDPNDRVHFDRE